tara:strand:- start:4053 stop:4886 length:834 start_codon:yes stop_codon:yes gene_type:complete
MSIVVTKADGSRERFKETKLRKSLKRSGATDEEVKEIVDKVNKILYDGIRTGEIYRRAFEFLRANEVTSAARYSLRRALFGLGPTGFPFEDFLAELFEAEGYKSRTRVALTGHCVEHELDVASYNAEHSFVCEAKFHARPSIKSDLQVVMYCYARFLDLRGRKICKEDHCGIDNFVVVTNTKFTRTAEDYAKCVGVELLSWDYPKKNNLHDRIQRAQIYPISTLQQLSMSDKRALIKRGIITCRSLLKNESQLRHLHISEKKFEAVISEARQLCHDQ